MQKLFSILGNQQIPALEKRACTMSDCCTVNCPLLWRVVAAKQMAHSYTSFDYVHATSGRPSAAFPSRLSRHVRVFWVEMQVIYRSSVS